MSEIKRQSPAGRLTSRLKEATLSTDRFIRLRKGTKQPAEKWRDSELGLLPSEVGQDYGVKCGDDLVVLDVDYPERLPEELPPTFVVESPHGDDSRGHWYYRVESAPTNSNEAWGELQAEGKLVVGPGSVLNHDQYCEDDCPLEGTSSYQIADDRPIATISTETLSKLSPDDTTETAPPRESGPEPPANLPIDSDDVAVVTAAIREFQHDCSTTQRALDYLMELANGQYQARGWGDDHSGAEVCLASKLYGILRFAGEAENAGKRIYSFISDACRENKYADTGEPRKWIRRGDEYRWNVVETVRETFSDEYWTKWRRKRSGDYEWSDDYSEITYEAVMKAVQSQFEENPGYPTRKEVVATAQALDGSRSERTHGNALHRLQREYGQVKQAYLGGNEYVYYPASEPDPPSAEWVSCAGNEFGPGVD